MDSDKPLPVSGTDLLGILNDLNIAFDLYEHEPVFTVSESDKVNADIPGVHCRNLFLRDKKKNMYLLVAANETQVDLKKLETMIGSARLSFGSADRLWEFLGVRPGSVCPFAAMNDKNGNVKVILDQDMMNADKVNYHPMENHMTVGLSPRDLEQFLNWCGHEPDIMDLKAAAPDE